MGDGTGVAVEVVAGVSVASGVGLSARVGDFKITGSSVVVGEAAAIVCEGVGGMFVPVGVAVGGELQPVRGSTITSSKRHP